MGVAEAAGRSASPVSMDTRRVEAPSLPRTSWAQGTDPEGTGLPMVAGQSVGPAPAVSTVRPEMSAMVVLSGLEANVLADPRLSRCSAVGDRGAIRESPVTR